MSVLAALAAAALTCSAPSQLDRLLVEFPDGSAEPAAALDGQLQALWQAAMLRSVDDYVIVGYRIVGSGDIAEGEARATASTEARAADDELGRARVALMADAVRGRGAPEAQIDAILREGRQVFTAEQMAADPALTDQVRGGVFLLSEVPRPEPVPGEPVPVC